jgi:hypothetical protein
MFVNLNKIFSTWLCYWRHIFRIISTNKSSQLWSPLNTAGKEEILFLHL